MKTVLYIVFGVLLINCAFAQDVAGTTLRHVENFNREWRFTLGDVMGAEAPAYDDAAWESVGLPHSFSIPYFGGTNSFYVGYGWYRKHFEVPAAWRDKRLFLHFEGAFQDAEIFINGKKVGAHLGGYTGFEVEITSAVVPGRNIAAVRLNNHWKARLAPRAGEHQFSGGLYRNVWLVATAPLHVTWFGTCVTTPRVSASEAVVNVKTEVVNQSPAPTLCTVVSEVADSAGAVCATMRTRQRIDAGDTVAFDQTSPSIPKPMLWSPEHPALYTIRTRVLADETPVDDFTTPFGFRWFEFTADKGFFLNGTHRYLRGANVHQDHAGWCDAVTSSGFQRDVGLIKDAGFDFIRGSHYPHAPAFSAACDELGMLFWSENAFWGTGGFDNPWGVSAYPTDAADESEFEASVRASLRDMIRIHRNHPSIVVWSMCNEVFFSDPSAMPKVRRFLRDLVAYSHELDPSRPAAIGGAQRGEIDKLGDIAGYNGDGAQLFPNPGTPSVVSEYGSMMADRPGPYEAGWGDLPYTPGADKNKVGSWRLPWRSGEAIWCGFDHGSIAGHKFGCMGLVDYFRLPKRQWYWYRNEYRSVHPPAWHKAGVPTALKLTSDKTTLRSIDGTDDAQLVVTVLDKDGAPLSNCPPVTLTIEAGPGEFPTGPSITFGPESDIVIRDGAAAIEFRSYYSGETRIRATSPGLKDAAIIITSLGAEKYIPGVTPPTTPRPYKRFSAAPSSGTWDKFGLENPTRVSSEMPGQSARGANDGNALTFWQAAKGDVQPWLRVDLERIVNFSSIRLTFPAGGKWRYRIEVSADGDENWQPFVQNGETETPNMWTSQMIKGASVSGRFVRVTLLQWPGDAAPGISEIAVSGTLSSR